MLDVTHIKIGEVFYNIDMTHIGTITKITEYFIEYEWSRVDGKPVIFSRTCVVSRKDFKMYAENFLELTPLEKELI